QTAPRADPPARAQDRRGATASLRRTSSWLPHGYAAARVCPLRRAGTNGPHGPSGAAQRERRSAGTAGRRLLQANVVLHRDDALHPTSDRAGHADVGARIDEAAELHRGLVSLDVDLRDLERGLV